MYIGASSKCNYYCQQDDKHKYDKSHAAYRHTIIDSDSFRQQNDIFIRKSKRAWNSFSIRLQSFFKKLKNELDFIEKQAFNRLELEKIKSAIKTQDKHLANISMDIFQGRYRNLTCQDVDQFLQLRKRHHGGQPIHIQREQDEFALDLLDQINSFIRDISQELAPKYERKSYRDSEDNRNNHKARDYNREKDNRERNIQRGRDNQRERDRRDYKDPQHTKKNQQRPQRNEKKEERKVPRRQEKEQYLQKDKKNLRQRNQPQSNKRESKANVRQQNPKEKEPCPLLKIDQLKVNCKAFDIDLKLMSFVKNIFGREMWKAYDQTGQIMLVVPTHNAIKEGAKIRMHNCYIKSYNQKLQICTKQNSKISYQNIKQQAFKFDYKNYRKQEKLQKNVKGNKQQKILRKIEDLSPDSQNFKIIAKVISVQVTKQTEKMCVLGDETGIVNARFICSDQLLKVGKILYFRGLEVEVDDCGHMFLTGSKVLIELAHDDIKCIKMNNNISDREYQLVE